MIMDVQIIEENVASRVESSAVGQVSTSEADRIQEPYEGMAFESEEAARAYYDEYAGFICHLASQSVMGQLYHVGLVVERYHIIKGQEVLPIKSEIGGVMVDMLNRLPMDEKDKRIQELTAELRIKKRLSAAYQDQLRCLVKDVESHKEHLYTKVQAVHSILKELELKDRSFQIAVRHHK